MASMHQQNLSDAELVAASLEGNHEAFGQLYDRYARLVRAVALDATLDWSSVGDMAQDTFLRAYKNLGQLRQPERFGAWAVGIARQVARERRRGLHRDRHEYIGTECQEFISRADGPESVDVVDEWHWVLAKVAELEERERLAIHSFFLDGRDVDRTAKLLGLSRSGTYALISRAMARLAEIARSVAHAKGTNQ
jgi:RNA polymerase sigma-70 factor (ECF subfamily)